MEYYHLKYNIYQTPGSPVEREEWLAIPYKRNESQIKQLLVSRYNSNITFIVCAQICKEEFDLIVRRPKIDLKDTWRISVANEGRWRLAERSNITKMLNDESIASDERYRNVLEPLPLL